MYRNPHNFWCPNIDETLFLGMRTRKSPTKCTKAYRKISEELSGLTQPFDFDLGFNDNMIHFQPDCWQRTAYDFFHDAYWRLCRMNQISLFILQMSSHSSIETPDLDALIERTWSVTEKQRMAIYVVYFHLMRWRDCLRSHREVTLSVCAQPMLSNSNKANQSCCWGLLLCKSTELQRIAWSLSNLKNTKI